MKKVFYSWQSDADRKVNHDFIAQCLLDAAASIKQHSGQDLEVQDGVRGEPGTPPLADTILSRIAAADVYVGDISLVYQADGSDGKRLSPNPNVAIELGFAIASLSLARVVSVQNVHFGKPEELPFDLRHLRWPLRYSLPPGASEGKIARQKRSLTCALKDAIELILKDNRPRVALLAKRTAVYSALANLVEQNQEWQLALRRRPLDAPELKSRGLKITEKIEGLIDEWQRLLVRTSAIDKLEQMHHAIAQTTLMIAGSPQRAESRALDVAETNELRTLIERIAKASEQIDKLKQQQAETEAELLMAEAEQRKLAIESLQADGPEGLPDASEQQSHAD